MFINEKGELKLVDFGLVRVKLVFIKIYFNEVVILWYRFFDVLLGFIEYFIFIDMWGVGCIYYEMVIGRFFFLGFIVKEELYFIFCFFGIFIEEMWLGVIVFFEFCIYSFFCYFF